MKAYLDNLCFYRAATAIIHYRIPILYRLATNEILLQRLIGLCTRDSARSRTCPQRGLVRDIIFFSRGSLICDLCPEKDQSGVYYAKLALIYGSSGQELLEYPSARIINGTLSEMHYYPDNSFRLFAQLPHAVFYPYHDRNLNIFHGLYFTWIKFSLVWFRLTSFATIFENIDIIIDNTS